MQFFCLFSSSFSHHYDCEIHSIFVYGCSLLIGIVVQYSIVCLYHNLLNHSIFDGHLCHLPLPSCYKQCCFEHLCTYLLVDICLFSLQKMDLWVIGETYVQLYQIMPTVFQSGSSNFTLSPVMSKRSTCFISLLILGIFNVKIPGH